MTTYLARTIYAPPLSRSLAVPFGYLLKSHVHVYTQANVNADLQELVSGVDYTWTSPSIIHLTATALPPRVRIQRISPSLDLIARASATGTASALTVNEIATQLLYLVQEAADTAIDVAITQSASLRVTPDLAPVNALAGTNKVVTLGSDGKPALVDKSTFKGDPGDPGGSASSIGLFATIATLSIPAGTDRIRTSGHTIVGTGGADYIYDAAVDAAYVTAHPLTSKLTTNGRGYRLDLEQYLTFEKFGAVGDAVFAAGSLSNSPTDCLPALNAILALSKSSNGDQSTPVVYAGGDNNYYFALTNPIEFHKRINLIGTARTRNDRGNPVGSCLVFPKSTGFAIFQGDSTNGRAARGAGGQGVSRGSYLGGWNYVGVGVSSDLTAHGIQLREPSTIIGNFYNIAGDALHIVGYTDGSAGQPYGEINSVYADIYVHDCGGNGLLNQGSDVNASEFHVGTHSCGGCGVLNLSYFACRFFLADIAGYGNGGVYDAGFIYALQNPFLGASTVAPGSAPNDWRLVGTGGPYGNFPQWITGTTYRMQLPFYDGGSGSIWEAPYVEVSVNPPIVRSPSLILNGTGAGANQYLNSSLFAGGNGGAVVAGRGFGVFGTIDSTHSFSDTWGTQDPSGAQTNMVRWFELTDPNNVDRYFTQWINGNLVTYHSGGKTVEWQSPTAFFTDTVDTISKFGRYQRQSNIKALPNFALGSGDYNTTHRIHQYGTAAPTSGDYARGEIVWNSAPAAGGVPGWMCTTAGTLATAAWSGSNFWNYGDVVLNDTGKTYICTQRGSGAASGGPTGTGTGIVDGGAKWDYRATPFVFKALANLAA